MLAITRYVHSPIDEFNIQTGSYQVTPDAYLLIEESERLIRRVRETNIRHIKSQERLNHKCALD